MQDPAAGAIDDEDEYDDDGSGTLDFEAGHGTFITGIIQQLCPDAEVHVAGVLSSFGDGDVATVIAAFETALTHAGPFDLVILSLGGYMTDDDGTVFGAALDRLIGDGLGVAAAGNQSTSRPYFPAALPSIVGVGALGEGDKAWFTNFGGWVDACAPGIDVVSTFFTGDSDAPGRPAVHGLGPLERHQLLRPESGSAGGPGDVRHAVDPPERRGDGCPTTRVPVPGPRHRVQRLTAPTLADIDDLQPFDGPLGRH